MGIQINGQTDTVTAIDGSLNVGGDVTIPGVLTYDDVTNVDSVGVITARDGIRVTGDVGINRPTPSASLDVESASDQTVLRIRNNSGDNTRLLFANKAAGLGEIFYQGDFRFVDDENSDAERLRIDSSGDYLFLGGTLRIKNAANDTQYAALYADASNFHVNAGVNNLLLYTGGGERARIDSSGKVGIGTDNPTAHLQVYRETSFASNPIIQARSNNGSTNELKFEIDGDGDAYFNGNVGVGTDNPNSRQLSVYGAGINGTQIECRAIGANSSGLAMYAGRNFEIQSTTSTEANYPDSFIVYDRDANGYRMSIDGSGRVLMPAQPSFFSRPAAGYNLSAGSNTIGGTWSDVHDIGSHFSNGTFTAPVAGTYQFSWSVFVQSETTRLDAYIMVNGTNVMREEIQGYSSTGYNKNASVHGSYYLSANDAITFGLHSTAGTNIYVSAQPWSYASGFLVG